MSFCVYCDWAGRGLDALTNHWKYCEAKKEYYKKHGKARHLVEAEKRKMKLVK